MALLLKRIIYTLSFPVHLSSLATLEGDGVD
jgi:hypothetical protein